MNLLDKPRRDLVSKLLYECGLLDEKRVSFLESSAFISQDDGEMGSFSIVNKGKRTGVRDCAEARYVDKDGIEVIIALIVDDENYPTDVDFWKVDSAPLIEFPTAEDLIASKIGR